MPPTGSTTCARCGATVAAGVRFCSSCGADVSGPQGNVATAYVAPATAARPAPAQSALLDALRQATLGEYEILAELGRGGMATVYLAQDIALDRKVAIKLMSPALLEGEGMVERFKREARTAAALSHPHIIPIYAVKESEHLLFFVMKFIEGRALDSVIKQVGPLPIPMVQTILHQVGGALAYAHRRGIVHRDIKPANIMIDADGWAIVTDFGIAKVTEKQGLTMTGATIGTPSYMSPEQCAAKEVTGASDQYSLGIVVYEMLTGKLPFVADSVLALMYAHFNEPPPPVTGARPECPAELAAALQRMLEKGPADRFPDLDAAVGAIGGAPLAHDDPIRTQMMTLAADGSAFQLMKRVSTPRSPMPTMRPKAAQATAAPTTGMSLSPGRVTVVVGGAVQMTASRKSKSGVTVPGNQITWASTDSDVATVSADGLVTAVGPGTATITATMGTVSATGTVIVTPARPATGGRGLKIGGGLAVAAAGVAALLWIAPWREDRSSASPPQRALIPADSVRPAVPETTMAVAPVPPPASRPPAGAEPLTQPLRERGRAGDRRAQRNDSLIRSIRAEAQATRLRAVSAGATAVELAPGDGQRQAADALGRDGDYATAITLLTEAIASWTLAERTARERATRAAAPPPRTEPPVVTQP
ncbi:MAG: protein kinase domain-containing protein, partial [Gemmatimonadales bacterium]